MYVAEDNQKLIDEKYEWNLNQSSVRVEPMQQSGMSTQTPADIPSTPNIENR